MTLKEVDFYGSSLEGLTFDGENARNTFTLKLDKSSFNASAFKNCTFRNCRIINSCFASCDFDNVTFENVVFDDTYFADSKFVRVNFVNCSGLSAHHFYKYFQIDEATKLPSSCGPKDIDQVERGSMEKYLLDSSLSSNDKTFLQALFAKLSPATT